MAKNPARRKEPAPRRPAARRRATPASDSPDSPASSADAAEQRIDAPEPEPRTERAESGAAPAPDAAPNRDEIAQRAYEIYRERGGTHGTDLEDWLRAERELRDAARCKAS